MLLTMEEIKAQLRLDEDFDADDRHSGQRPGRATPAG